MTRTSTSISNSDAANGTETIKFLYSYGGKVVPRRSDGLLRYVGGFTRVLAVDRSITFQELMVRFGELCGSSMSLKCKLPSEDLDVLVSITCDEDLANVIDEYDRFSLSTNKDVKITAVLFPLKSLKKVSPVPSVDDLSSSTGSPANSSATSSPTFAAPGFRSAPPHVAAASCRCGGRNSEPAFGFTGCVQKDAGKVRNRPCCEQRSLPRHLYPCCGQGIPKHIYVVPRRNHCR